MTARAVPRATYRLQFHKHFTFADAETLVPYFAALGVSHLYASPILTARAGSSHGYDVIDPMRVNPELGGEDALKRLVAALRRQGMGLIVDIVPNHMAATLDNGWWLDVLRFGQESRYARFFDIDWDCEDPSLRGKVLLPWLDKPLREAEQAGDVDRLGLPRTGAYQLAWWRTASDRINWRRFFDINDLVCLDMDNDEAFEAVHATIVRLYAEGVIDGVRVDHVDGLADPANYCRKLRRRLEPQSPERPYLVVEKILLRGEQLPKDWGCNGTTGYDFMDEVSALQHDPAAERTLAEAWARISGRPADFRSEEIAARREIIQRSFGAALEACVGAFEKMGQRQPVGCDLSRPALRRAIVELLVNFPVYRSYGAARTPYVDEAAARARHSGLASDRWVIDILHRWMSIPLPDDRAIVRFQQLSAPIAAKAVEDTAFYRYGRLLSRNDVGFDVEHFATSPDDFHARMQRRSADYPDALLATATHDHKRGEDVRARLAVLSEMPQRWAGLCSSWIHSGAALKSGDHPSAGDIALLFQTIVGAWPFDLELADGNGRKVFAERLANWQQKALREAKLQTDWADPNEHYERAAQQFLNKLVVDNQVSGLLADVFAFVQEIIAPGAVNSLAQVLLKLTVPGVPDLYQGSEGWDLSLVDPDNRRPVDFAVLQRSLRREPLAGLLKDWCSGQIKQALIARILAVRRALPDLFARGSYEPVPVRGEKSKHIVAFLRRCESDIALVVVPRLPSRLLTSRKSLVIENEVWGDTRLELPGSMTLFDGLRDRRLQFQAPNVAIQDLTGRLPLAFFSTCQGF